MALPTSPMWDLADFSGLSLNSLLSLGPGDLTITPTPYPYFGYSADLSVLQVSSSNGVEGSARLTTGLPGRFTLDLVVRFPSLPNSLGDLGVRRCGITLADDAGRGFTLYFAKTGFAVSRVDVLGAASALPDTSDVTASVTERFYTIRVAMDGALGRAYIFVGEGATEQPALRWIVPVEQTPEGVVDLFQIFAMGTSVEPVLMEIRSLRLASGLVIANYPPVADAGPDRVAAKGQAVRLDGRASYDLEAAPLSYLWRMIDAPFGSEYVAEVSAFSTVDDGDADGVTPILVTSPLALPAWLSAGDVVRVGAQAYPIDSVNTALGQVTLVEDVLPDNLAGVPGRFLRQSVLTNATSETPSVLADAAGLYRFALVVSDGESWSAPSEVLVNITAARAPFGIEPDVSPLWKALGDEWQLIPERKVFEEAWRGVTQILAGKLLEAWQHHFNSSVRDAQRVFQRKWVAYRTLETETSPDTVAYGGRWGAKTGTFAFETGLPATEGQVLMIDYVPVAAESTQLQTLVISLPSGAGATQLAAIVTAINAAAAVSTFPGRARGGVLSKDSATYRWSGTCTTAPDGDADGTTPNATLSAAPPWVKVGDVFVVGGKQYRVTAPGTSLAVTPELPDNLSTSTACRLYRACRLSIHSPQYFCVRGAAAATLGIDALPNYLEAEAGARITDTLYFVGDFVSLLEQGVQRNDLLVMNNGESVRIDRIITDPLDALPGQRALVFDTLPLDASRAWAIPSVVRSTAVDYELAGVYPGDLAKVEIYHRETGETQELSAQLIAQRNTQLAVTFPAALAAATAGASDWEMRLLGVRRRKALRLPADVVSIPRLQDKIPVSAAPAIYKENVHYILEPFYRDIGGAPVPMLQFRDSVFIEPDNEPPEILWAELTLFSNEGHVEDLFGRLVGFTRDDARELGKDFNYVAGVAGLLYAKQRGPNEFAMTVGAQILLGQPFAEVAGYVEETRGDYSPLVGRILLRDDDGNTPTTSEVVRAYYYKKDPLDQSNDSGLARNLETGQPWQVGELVPQFSPLGAGIRIYDTYNNPSWWIPFVRSGTLIELQKFHTFLVEFNTDLVSVANIQLLHALMTTIKPRHGQFILSGARDVEEDLDVQDSALGAVELNINESPGPTLHSFIYDDYRGNGRTASLHDDGYTKYDGRVDNPTDLVSLTLEFAWVGGVITESLPYGPGTVDVTGGQTGVAGSTFTSSLGMTLAAGTYRIAVQAKAQGIVYP